MSMRVCSCRVTDAAPDVWRGTSTRQTGAGDSPLQGLYIRALPLSHTTGARAESHTSYECIFSSVFVSCLYTRRS